MTTARLHYFIERGGGTARGRCEASALMGDAVTRRRHRRTHPPSQSDSSAPTPDRGKCDPGVGRMALTIQIVAKESR